ncbi:MAG: dihydrolipoamide acetyltransferase family protein [Actinobacteria bacterium]|nr:dihydrolipoamide acetyltransferase family protein [Actinomycetota bacterium]
MAREFRLPDIGEGLTEAEIVRWLIAEGDPVEADQPIVEVETDKAVVEIPSPYEGIVVRHGGAEGETIAVGAVLVVIGEHDEAVGEEPLVEVSEVAPIVGTLIEEAEVIESAPRSPAPVATSVKALPIVRKLARDAGLDLETVTGTGTGGRIMREDVESAIAALPPVSRSDEDASPPGTLGEVIRPRAETDRATPPDERRPMSRLRRTIAANMSKSWAEIPHVTTFDDVDATRLFEVRAALSERHDTKIPIEALVVRAVLPALHAFPEFNATLDGDDLLVHGSHDVGIAVDTPDGLLVAVIRDADSMGVLELATEVGRLGKGARERKLTPDELTGQTFTVSNIGAVGGGHGTPIVPPGTTAILSIGRAKSKPIVDDGDLVIAPVMPLSLSYDHRVIDGGLGRRFMALLMENLEEPALFLAG